MTREYISLLCSTGANISAHFFKVQGWKKCHLVIQAKLIFLMATCSYILINKQGIMYMPVIGPLNH